MFKIKLKKQNRRIVAISFINEVNSLFDLWNSV